MNLYFISGLGADKRAFQRIELPAKYKVHFIEWIKNKKDETLEDYATRLTSIIDRSKPFALVGLSFGGIIASTLQDSLKPAVTVLISSASNKRELPWYYRTFGTMRMDKLIPQVFFAPNNPSIYWLFGAKTEAEKKILREILKQNDPSFLKWSIGKIVRWEQETKPAGVVHIHGTADHILPFKYSKADIAIKNGTHFMIWTRAGEISKALQNILDNYSQE